MNIGFDRGKYAEVGFTSEKSDCVVRATAVAADLEYADVHHVFARHGRRSRRGTNLGVIQKSFAELFPGSEQRRVNLTLAQFIRLHPKGRFVVMTRLHAWAVVDSVVHDWELHPRYRVILFWEVSNDKA
jgi:hypothetical protein